MLLSPSLLLFLMFTSCFTSSLSYIAHIPPQQALQLDQLPYTSDFKEKFKPKHGLKGLRNLAREHGECAFTCSAEVSCTDPNQRFNVLVSRIALLLFFSRPHFCQQLQLLEIESDNKDFLLIYLTLCVCDLMAVGRCAVRPVPRRHHRTTCGSPGAAADGCGQVVHTNSIGSKRTKNKKEQEERTVFGEGQKKDSLLHWKGVEHGLEWSGANSSSSSNNNNNNNNTTTTTETETREAFA